MQCPTLLLVSACDEGVLELNQRAAAHMPGPTTLTIVPRATHLFEEPGTLEAVARLGGGWFARHLPKRGGPSSGQWCVDFLVIHLREVAVKLAYRLKIFRRLQAHHLVRHGPDFLQGIG